MVSEFAPKVRRRRIVRRVAAVIGLGGVLASALAFRAFFARPGEATLSLIPKNAMIFGTADLSPSPTQTLVFKKIDDALSRNGLDKKIQGALTDVVAHGPVAEQLRPYSKRAAAFAMVAPETKGKDWNPDDCLVAYFGLSDGPAVNKILAANGRKLFWKGTQYYQLDRNGPGMMVIGDTLVVSSKGPLLHTVERVSDGEETSILDRPDFVAEREKLDGDSNVMVFMAPEAFAMFAENSPQDTQDLLKSEKWVALGVAIRDGGIALSVDGDYDPAKAKWMMPMASMAPIRSDLMAVLPKGAYGMTVLSQPSKYFDCFETSMGENPDGRRMVRDMEDSLAKEMTLSLRQDVLPAFQGNAIAAFYPSESADKVAGIDALVVIDDQNGAKAGALAERVREYVERQIEKNGNEPKPFEVTNEGGVTRYRLSNKAEQDFQSSFSQGMDEEGAFDGDVISKDKTITWAIVGQTVVGSTSAKLLDRAIAGLSSHQNGLDTDKLWASSQKSLLDGSQFLTTFSVARIAEGFENTAHIDKMGDDSKTVQDVVDALKGLTEPFSIKTKSTDGEVSVKLFIPMDYDRLLDMIGKQ